MQNNGWLNDGNSYGKISRILHWSMALLIVLMFAIGWSIGIIPKSWKPISMGTHKSLGIIILLLAFFRLVWRLYNVPPKLPQSIPAWQKITSTAVHYSLYLLLFAMPITGWAMVSAKGRPIMFLGMFQLPDLVEINHDLGEQLEDLHGDIAYILAVVVAAHAIAALYHHFIRKDSVLTRMLPSLKNKS